MIISSYYKQRTSVIDSYVWNWKASTALHSSKPRSPTRERPVPHPSHISICRQVGSLAKLHVVFQRVPEICITSLAGNLVIFRKTSATAKQNNQSHCSYRRAEETSIHFQFLSPLLFHGFWNGTVLPYCRKTWRNSPNVDRCSKARTSVEASESFRWKRIVKCFLFPVLEMKCCK